MDDLFAENMQKIEVEMKNYINFFNNTFLALKYTFRTPISVGLISLNIRAFQTIQLVMLTLFPDPSPESVKMSNTV